MASLRLGVNVDHIATVRQQRRGETPDPVEAAQVCLRAGASGIVCHLREDRRHIQDEDVKRLRAVITSHLNLEMSMAPAIIDVALAIRPDQATFVPEHRAELTTEGGLDVIRLSRTLPKIIETFRAGGIVASLFIDPAPDQIRAAREAGATVIELHTGRYANARGTQARARELSAIREAARSARTLGLSVAAGHGLDYDNVQAVAAIPEVEELNIGFSIVARALAVGLERAVREMAALMKRPAAHALETA